MLRVVLTGGVFLFYGSREVPLPNRKARAILALMALSDPPELPRERLTGMFWSESEQTRANATLRQAVHEARTALAAAGCDVLRTTRLTVGLRPDLFVVDATETLIAVETPGASPPRFMPCQTDALFQGFEDLDPAFADWLTGWRAAMQARLVRGLERGFREPGLARALCQALAEAALLLDPAHEEACRTVMRCAAEAGETGAALRAYDALYALLDADFDMEPSTATQKMVAEIKQGKYDIASVSEHPSAFAEPIRSGPPWIAVMPFRSLGPDPMPTYLAEGLVDDIVRMLAGLREPVVISSNSTRAFRDIPADPRQIGRLFGVRYIVSGTARAAGRTLRLTAELSDAASSEVLWAQAYDAQDTMVFEAQDRIVEQIANRVAPRVHEAELRRIRIQRPKDLSAYHLTLEARDMIFGLEEEPFARAGQLLRQAIALEPDYAAAHGALASWFSLRLGQGWSADRKADVSELHRHATNALRLDGANARAMALLGHGKTIFEHRHNEGVSLSDQALDIAPNDAEVWLLSGPTRAYMGDGNDAVRRVERALRLSPQDPHIFRAYHFLCIAHYARESYEEAAHFGTLSFHANPRYTSNSRLTAGALVELGRLEEARAFAGNAMMYEPGFRATEMLKRQPFTDISRRERYVRQLLAAGMPA